MELSKKSIAALSEAVANAVINALEKRGSLVEDEKQRPKKNAYQKTESLLYNYCGFKKIVQERMKEIEELREHGVPERSASIVQYSPNCGGTVDGIVLPEESVENAVHYVEASIVETIRAIEMVDKGMAALKDDPYYDILEMRYFEGRTQEDIAFYYGCSQVTISNHKNRLVKELSMQLFPNQVAEEMLN